MSARLTEERLTQIRALFGKPPRFDSFACETIRDLLRELDAVRAERDRYKPYFDTWPADRIRPDWRPNE